MAAPNPEGRNQYVIAAEQGLPIPRGANQFTTGRRTRMDPMDKAKIRAAFAAQKLTEFIRGETELDSAKVAACKALMDKGMPSLASVEQTTVEAPMAESDIITAIGALLEADPGLRSQLTALLSGQPTIVPAPQTGSDQAEQAA